MLISKELSTTINAQIGNELGASMQYLQIASHFSKDSLPNFAKFFFAQSEEEREHAMKLLHFLLEVGADVKIPAIPEMKSEFASAEEAVGAALNWEMEVTKQIYNLVDIAVKDKDYISQRFLDWFVSEQLEEISSMETLLAMIKRVGEKNIFQLESHVLALRG